MDGDGEDNNYGSCEIGSYVHGQGYFLVVSLGLGGETEEGTGSLTSQL